MSYRRYPLYTTHYMNVKLPIIYSIYVITMMLTIHWCCYFPYPLWWTVYDGWSMSSLIFTWLWLCVFLFFSCFCSFFFSMFFSCFIILLDLFDFWAILFFSLSYSAPASVRILFACKSLWTSSSRLAPVDPRRRFPPLILIII